MFGTMTRFYSKLQGKTWKLAGFVDCGVKSCQKNSESCFKWFKLKPYSTERFMRDQFKGWILTLHLIAVKPCELSVPSSVSNASGSSPHQIRLLCCCSRCFVEEKKHSSSVQSSGATPSLCPLNGQWACKCQCLLLACQVGTSIWIGLPFWLPHINAKMLRLLSVTFKNFCWHGWLTDCSCILV